MLTRPFDARTIERDGRRKAKPRRRRRRHHGSGRILISMRGARCASRSRSTSCRRSFASRSISTLSEGRGACPSVEASLGCDEASFPDWEPVCSRSCGSGARRPSHPWVLDPPMTSCPGSMKPFYRVSVSGTTAGARAPEDVRPPRRGRSTGVFMPAERIRRLVGACPPRPSPRRDHAEVPRRIGDEATLKSTSVRSSDRSLVCLAWTCRATLSREAEGG